MALSFDDAYQIMQKQGREIGLLARRGDKVAKDVVVRYTDWYNHEYRDYIKWKQETRGIGTPPKDTGRRLSLIRALETYLQRDLTLHEREHLAGTKGHIIEDETGKEKVSNIVQLEVARAIHRKH